MKPSRLCILNIDCPWYISTGIPDIEFVVKLLKLKLKQGQEYKQLTLLGQGRDVAVTFVVVDILTVYSLVLVELCEFLCYFIRLCAVIAVSTA